MTVYFFGKYENLCPQFSFTQFPFDSQNCALILYTNDPNYYFYFSSVEARTDPTKFIGESEIWEYKNTSISIQDYGDATLGFREITVNLSFQRKYHYYIGNILLPSFGLCLLQLAAMLLPPDTSDRPMFSITVVLAYTFVLTSVFSLIPRTTGTVYLVVLLEIKLFLSIFITCYMLVLCFVINRFGKVIDHVEILTRKLDAFVAIFSLVTIVVSDIILMLMMTK